MFLPRDYFQDSSEKAVFKITMSLGPGFCLRLNQNVASMSFEDENSQNSSLKNFRYTLVILDMPPLWLFFSGKRGNYFFV